MELETLLWNLLGYGVLPLWLACGMADYACHQATDIPHTSGLHESLLHLLETVQIGVPVLVLLFFLLASGLGLSLVISALRGDRKAKPREERGPR